MLNTRECKKIYEYSRKNQSPEFVQQMHDKFSKFSFYLPYRRILHYLDQFYDKTNEHFSSELQNAYFSAEKALQDGKSDWFVVSVFIKNFGKLLYLFDEPELGLSKQNQWAITGQSFITGCAYPSQILYPEFNPENDFSPNGIYKHYCGLKNTFISYNHSEYIYQFLSNPLNKNLLPPEALYCIRYNNLHLHHKNNAYNHLLDDYDKAMLPLLKEFAKYDLCGFIDIKMLKFEILWKMFFENYGLYL